MPVPDISRFAPLHDVPIECSRCGTSTGQRNPLRLCAASFHVPGADGPFWSFFCESCADFISDAMLNRRLGFLTGIAAGVTLAAVAVFLTKWLW